jgi:hypothetical protein
MDTPVYIARIVSNQVEKKEETTILQGEEVDV